MKITDISLQARDKNRINVSVDGRYRFSLDVFQVGDLGIKIGKEYSEAELIRLETEGRYSRLYNRALEYCLIRPHSAKEVRDYLWRKTRSTKKRSPRTGEIIEKLGVSQEVADRVYDRLVEKGYVDDDKFTRFWLENRNQTKGTSRRKLIAELRIKGVERTIIERYLEESSRTDADELVKIIAKKRARYPDEQKFMQYLARQGFSYDNIKNALAES
ncbi:MAG: regulatory protein RecX [Candidatus Saccharimonadales bacterium]